MADKFIPDRDVEFANFARNFATNLALDPQRYSISTEDASLLTSSVEKFRAIFSNGAHRQSGVMRKQKKQARQDAEKIIRRIHKLIRANDQVTAVDLCVLGLRERAKPTKGILCPNEPPNLWFARALHEGNAAAPMHELKFRSLNPTKRKPDGAVRLELFIDLIGLDEELPNHPAENYAGRPWYWGSFTKSPIVLAPPMPRVPMIVLYWARWADAACNVGPFCKTVRATAMVGGMTRFALKHFDPARNPMRIEEVPETRDVTIRVAVLEMQRRTMLPSVEVPDRKQLEAPPDESTDRKVA